MTTEFFKVNGIRVANIKHDSDITFFGIGVKAGSNYENAKNAGVSHFAEHMFFKGTEKRNWKNITEEFALLGAQNNAYTDNTDVLYHATCPSESLGSLIDLMSDLFFNSKHDVKEIEKERTVIIEEKKMYDDNPQQAFMSEIGNKMFVWDKGHDTIGTFDTIGKIKRKDIVSYMDDKYTKDNILIICCGNIDSKDLKRYLNKSIPSSHRYLSQSKSNEVSDGFWNKSIKGGSGIKLKVEKESITQSQIFMFTRSLSVFDPDYYNSVVLYSCLGGGMYSSLFSRIREELGLCYSVGMYTHPIAYPSHSVASLYGSTSPENVTLFMEESEKVLQGVLKNGIDKTIFRCSKMDFLSGMLRSIETSSGKSRVMFKRYLLDERGNIEDFINKIRDIKIEDCNKLVDKLLDVPYNWAVMVPKNAKSVS